MSLLDQCSRSPAHPVSQGDWPGVVIELRPAPDPCDAFQRLCHLRHCVFFDSQLRDPGVGRYSFLAIDPFDVVAAAPHDRRAWEQINRRLQRFLATTLAGLPPFQGGAAGLFSYDLSRSLERVPAPRHDEFDVPGVVIGFYDVVVAFDHATQEAWIISQGFPELEPARRHVRAQLRAEQVLQLLGTPQPPAPPERAAPGRNVLPEHLAPRFPVAKLPGLTSNFSPDGYLAMVDRAIQYIYAGDVFQVNLAQRLMYPAQSDSVSLYLRLRQCNPAPFAAYFDLGDFQLISASPERFLQVTDRRVETRPIKGTRSRMDDPEVDRLAGVELLESEKDRAENVMIVDLLRNDLSRVCLPDSVVVSELCRLERFQFVQHLVSVVHGTLREGLGALDLLQAAFPGGSITGAPKIRAMEIIAELEPTARGAYCGSLAYIGFDGAMDSSILIRTITAGRGWWQFAVGGGIVAQSDPHREYEETWHKSEGLIRALR